jgi:hypothetical protein
MVYVVQKKSGPYQVSVKLVVLDFIVFISVMTIDSHCGPRRVARSKIKQCASGTVASQTV